VLLRADLLPEAYIAPRELRDVRDLLRHRAALVAMCTALKNRVHALLARHGIHHQHADLFGKAGTSIYLLDIASSEIISTVHGRRSPTISATAGLQMTR
jgi:transposase